MKPFDYPKYTIALKDGIVWVIFKENAEIEVDDIREMTRAAEQLTNKEPHLLLSDARVHLSISPEAREVSADIKETPNTIANAVIINNLATRFIANFFKNFNKPHYKFQVFNDEARALKWLEKYRP